MNDNLLLKLEEKVMVLLTELEVLRKETGILKQENAHLKNEKGNFISKMQGLVSLLDSLDVNEQTAVATEHQYAPAKEEFAMA
jgi:regulator of replication initiation timing